MPSHAESVALNLWRQLTQPQVRQLAWVCFGPKLILEWPSPISNRVNPFTSWAYDWLQALEQDPAPLLAHLAQIKNPRLGFLYEAYWQFYLQQNPATELLAFDLAVHHQGSTLGAFDLLFIDEQQQVVHLELALKYYLGLPWFKAASNDNGQQELGVWLGPGQQDQLARKYQHLHQKQLQLTELEAVQAFLNAQGLPQATRKQACIQGLLFQAWQQEMSLSAIINPHCASNQWVTQQDLAQLLAQEPTASFIPLKQDQWLAPTVLNEQALNATQLELFCKTHFNQSPGLNRKTGQALPSRPLQILHTNQAQGLEPKRLFICPNNWPRAEFKL